MERPRTLGAWRTSQLLIAPSVLAADFAELGSAVRDCERGGAELIHLDIMDGHFVPNLSIGPAVVAALRPHCRCGFDVHLMLSEPRAFVEPFVKAGADHITIHVEAADDVRATLAVIQRAGCSAGLSLRPRTAAAALTPFLDLVDMILVMTVEPGFGGQAFRADQLAKVAEIRELIGRGGRPVHVEVDGGIDAQTAPACVKAGANVLVAGSSVFRAAGGIGPAIAALRRAATA